MKLQITEEQLKTIIGNISEQIVPGKGRDPWQYKKNGNRYFVAKKNTNSWKEVFGDIKIAVQNLFVGKKEYEKVVRDPKDFKGIQVSDSTNKIFLNKLDPKKLKTNSSVKIFDGGQPECAQFVNDFEDKIKAGDVGDAWAAKDNNKLGSLVYSAFDNLSNDKITKVIDLWQKIDNKGGGKKGGSYIGQAKTLISNIVKSSSFSNLKLGDIVGIYYPPSSWHEYAFYTAGIPYFMGIKEIEGKAAFNAMVNAVSRKVNCSKTVNPNKCKQSVLDLQVILNDSCKKLSVKLKEDGQPGYNTENAMKICKMSSSKKPNNKILSGKGWGMNTHVGIVGAIKNGIPLIFHNIHSQVYADPQNMLHDGGKIVWVRRPSIVRTSMYDIMPNTFKAINKHL